MPDLEIIDLNVANPMTMLFEKEAKEAKEAVQHHCREIYALKKVTP